MVFPVVMYGCESWTRKKVEHWRTDAFELWLEKTLEGPLDCNKIKPVSSKENQPRIFIGRTDAEAETPILWTPDAESQLIGKDPDDGKGWGQKGKRAAEGEMVGWHRWLSGRGSEQSPGKSEGQGCLLCWSPWCHRESGKTWWQQHRIAPLPLPQQLKRFTSLSSHLEYFEGKSDVIPGLSLRSHQIWLLSRFSLFLWLSVV